MSADSPMRALRKDVHHRLSYHCPMPVGQCRLCQNTRELLDSHYLPRGFYKRTRESDPSLTDPVVLNKKIALYTSEQASDYLLCRECETRFNEGGEKWVLANCAQPDGSFPLRTTVLGCPTIFQASDLTVYSTVDVPGVNQAKLSYFAASIFSRGGAHRWHLLEDQKPLTLGPYLEELRRYLLGDTDLPANIAIMVAPINDSDTRAWAGATFPWRKGKEPTFSVYSFNMCGIIFRMFVGKSMVTEVRKNCVIRAVGNPVFMGERIDRDWIQSVGSSQTHASPKGKLAKEQP